MANLILSWFGWNLPSDHDFVRFSGENSKRLVIVISHTSYWDFFLLLLYRQVDPRIQENLYLVMKPQPFETWGWFLEPLGCLPATRGEDSNQGFVKKTTTKFQDKDFRLIISPEGKMEASPWKSGYYHLSRETKSSIMVAGLDYERKSFYLGPVHSWEETRSLSKSELEKVLQKEMGEIVPLYPDLSHTPISRDYDLSKIEVIGTGFRISILLLILVLIVLIFYYFLYSREE
jgi:1-acyl-sn-glycerol-3-phosphate acyltransferase